MTTRSFLVNLLEIVDEARLRIPIVRDIKLPGFSLVMECFLPSTPPLAVLLSLSRSFARVLAFSGHRSHVCNETLQIHRAVGLLGKYLNLHSATILFRWKIGRFEEARFLISSSFHSNHGQEHQYLDTVETRLFKQVKADLLLPKLWSTVIS